MAVVYAVSLVFISLGAAMILFASRLGTLHAWIQRRTQDWLYGAEAVARATPPVNREGAATVYAWLWRMVGLVEAAFGVWILIEALSTR